MRIIINKSIFILKTNSIKKIFKPSHFKPKSFKAIYVCLLFLTATASMTFAQAQLDGSYWLRYADIEIDIDGYITTFYDSSWDVYLGVSSSNSTLVIPDILGLDTIKGIRNRSITSSSFSGKKIKSLQLPQTMEVIGSYAFQGNRLDSVNFSDLTALTTIGNNAFQGNRLTSLNLSNLTALTTIGDSAFQDNNSLLISVNFSGLTALTTIGNSAFQGNRLDSVNFSDLTALTTIGNSAFQGNRLTSLDLSNLTALTTIGNSAFQDNRLISLDLSNLTALTTLSGFAYNSLTSLDLSNLTALTTIGNSAFQGNMLTSLDLSNQAFLMHIGNSAFQGNMLTSLDLSNQAFLMHIGNSAFQGNMLTSLDLSNQAFLMHIGNSAFIGNNFNNFELSPGIDWVIYNWTDGSSIYYSGGTVTNLTSGYTRKNPNTSYQVTFTIFNNGVALQGANITLGESYGQDITDRNGQGVFRVYVSDLAATGGTLYSVPLNYTITREGRTVKTGQIIVDSTDLTVDIFLTPFYDTLRFTVVDRANNSGLPNASVTIGDRTDMTDTNGKVIFHEIPAVSGDSISFEVQGAGYATFMGKVENPDSIIVTKAVDKVFLDRYHKATFRVVDSIEATPVAAAITLNEITLTGDFSVFDSLVADIYEYSATFEGYVTKAGNITITNTNVEETIQLVPNPIDTMATGIAADVVLQLFPNPAEQSITITGAGGYDISFYDLTGRLVKHIPQVQGSTQVNISRWATGIYTVRVGDRTKKLIVK